MYCVYESTPTRTWYCGKFKMEKAHKIARDHSASTYTIHHIYKVYAPNNVCVASYKNGKRL